MSNDPTREALESTLYEIDGIMPDGIARITCAIDDRIRALIADDKAEHAIADDVHPVVRHAERKLGMTLVDDREYNALCELAYAARWTVHDDGFTPESVTADIAKAYHKLESIRAEREEAK